MNQVMDEWVNVKMDKLADESVKKLINRQVNR